jgi:hypothetical protein
VVKENRLLIRAPPLECLAEITSAVLQLATAVSESIWGSKATSATPTVPAAAFFAEIVETMQNCGGECFRNYSLACAPQDLPKVIIARFTPLFEF